MCNLNILIKEKKDRKYIVTFLQSVTSNSYASNPDGEGLYCDGSNKVIKQNHKINLFDYKDDIRNSEFIITHQRISTSGKINRYNHPFESEDFVLVHNGIINDFLGKKGSDTYGFFIKFNDLFLQLKLSNREARIVNAIKILLNKKENGSYSIVIFDKKTKKLYYFKNETTSIHFYRFNHKLFITTKESNFNFIDLFGKKKITELAIKDYHIYRVEKKRKIMQIYDIAKIKKPKLTDGWFTSKPINEQTKIYDINDKNVKFFQETY